MKLNNKRGIAALVLLAYILGGLLVASFFPNPISASLGMGIKPNKTVETQKVEFLKKDLTGTPVPEADGSYLIKTSTSSKDIQQHVTLWEQIRNLPVLILILMALGIIGVPTAIQRHNAWVKLKTDTQKIVLSVDKGLAYLKAKDPVLHQAVLNEIGDTQAKPSSAEVVVNKAQIGQL